MSNQLTKIEDKEQRVVYEVNGEEITLSPSIVVNYLTQGKGNVTNQEVVMFINLCKYQKLNPFLNEAYLVKYGNAQAQLITSKEAFMKRAEAHPAYESLQAGVIVMRDGEMKDIEGAIKLPDDVLLGGWAEVGRKDRTKPITVRLSFEEFNTGQSTWKQMPLNMIRKTAIVNAQREAFPDSLGALYTEDDVQDFSNQNPVQEVQEEIKEKANTKTISIEPENIIEGEIVLEEKEEVKVTIEESKEDSEDVMPGQASFVDGPDFGL